MEVAARAGLSVEYLTRIEQGRDRNPSPSVVNAIADALNLQPADRRHLVYLTKISGGACASHRDPEPPVREVRESALRMLQLLEPGVAMITNRLGDVLAHTSAFAGLMADTGLLDGDEPNLTRFVFVDPRARQVFADWDQVADEQAFDLWMGPSAAAVEWFTADLAPVAGPALTERYGSPVPPARSALVLDHPRLGRLRLTRERLEISESDEQQVVVLLAEDAATEQALAALVRDEGARPGLRAV